eukprot:162548_1
MQSNHYVGLLSEDPDTQTEQLEHHVHRSRLHFLCSRREGLPEDIFIACMSFLSIHDVNASAAVSRFWKHCAYDPSLWPKLDLSKFPFGVHDQFLKHLFTTSRRFSELRSLSLEGCSAITDQSLLLIGPRCPLLTAIRLTGCFRLGRDAIVRMVGWMPQLDSIELFGAVEDVAIVDEIRRIRPWIKFGFLWFSYCAKFGCRRDLPPPRPRSLSYGSQGGDYSSTDEMKIEVIVEESPVELRALRRGDELAPLLANEEVASAASSLPDHSHIINRPPKEACRYDQSFDGGGCWGDVTGRIVYSNQEYHRGGNYPSEILYSCGGHDEMDFKENDFVRCEECRDLFEEESCWSEIVCKVCYDKKNLQNKNNWIALNDKSVKEFDFAALVRKTLIIADDRNLPSSLKEIATVQCDLDFRYAYDAGGVGEDDDVPVRVFWEGNQARVDENLHNVRTALHSAQNRDCTRALLVYDEQDKTRILADRGVVFHGPDGEEYLNLTLDALSHFNNIFLPLLGTLVVAAYFISFRITFGSGPPRTIHVPQLEESQDYLGAMISSTVVFFVTIVIIFILRHVERIRLFCISFILPYALVLDIFLIIAMGVFFMIFLICLHHAIPLDWFSLLFLLLNYSACGVWSFYHPTPNWFHRYHIVSLHCIMAVLVYYVLQQFLLPFIIFGLLSDVFTMIRPRWQFLMPFLIPRHFEEFQTTPRIFYDIDGLRLRASDFMFYGMFLGLVNSSTLTLTLGVATILASVLVALYILPFFSKNIPPLPFAFAVMVAADFIASRTFSEEMFSIGKRHFLAI